MSQRAAGLRIPGANGTTVHSVLPSSIGCRQIMNLLVALANSPVITTIVPPQVVIEILTVLPAKRRSNRS